MHLGHTYGAARERHPFLLKPLCPAIFGYPQTSDVSRADDLVVKKARYFSSITSQTIVHCIIQISEFYMEFTLHTWTYINSHIRVKWSKDGFLMSMDESNK